MFRKLVLGIITTGFMFGVFFAPISPLLQSNTGSITPNYAYAEEEPPVQQVSGEVTVKEISCGITDIFCGIVKFTVGIWMFVSQMVLVAVALILDFAVEFSLSSSSYTGDIGTFIDTGWKIVRDFTNILFIFGLLVAAFFLILQPRKRDTVAGIGNDPKRIVVMVILMALLVNFSLFFTKVIVDLGNVPARVFYEKIATPQPPNTNNIGSGEGTFVQDLVGSTGMTKSIGLGIISKANPQKLILSAYGDKGVDSQGNSTENESFDIGSWSGKLFYLFTGLLVFILNIVLIYIFGVMILIFLGRTFMLWLAMVLSPLAFVLKAVPVGFLQDFSFDTWLKKTTELAFLAPLFMFFAYLALMAMDLVSVNIGGNSFMGNIVEVSINLIAVAFILLKGKTIAIKMSGEIGQAVSKMSGAIAGVAVGAATGGTAFLARQTLGRAGAALANSKTLQGAQSGGAGAENKWGGTKFGKFAGRGADWMTKGAAKVAVKGGAKVQGSSFDIRNARIGGKSVEQGIQKLDPHFRMKGLTGPNSQFVMGNRFLNANGFTVGGGAAGAGVGTGAGTPPPGGPNPGQNTGGANNPGNPGGGNSGGNNTNNTQNNTGNNNPGGGGSNQNSNNQNNPGGNNGGGNGGGSSNNPGGSSTGNNANRNQGNNSGGSNTNNSNTGGSSGNSNRGGNTGGGNTGGNQGSGNRGGSTSGGGSSHYETLGVNKNATDAEVTKAYKQASQKYHPDKFGNADAATQKKMTEKFQEINNAYSKIKKERGPGFGKGPKPGNTGPQNPAGSGGGPRPNNTSSNGPSGSPTGGAQSSGGPSTAASSTAQPAGEDFSAFSQGRNTQDADIVRNTIRQLGPSTTPTSTNASNTKTPGGESQTSAPNNTNTEAQKKREDIEQEHAWQVKKVQNKEISQQMKDQLIEDLNFMKNKDLGHIDQQFGASK